MPDMKSLTTLKKMQLGVKRKTIYQTIQIQPSEK